MNAMINEETILQGEYYVTPEVCRRIEKELSKIRGVFRVRAKTSHAFMEDYLKLEVRTFSQYTPFVEIASVVDQLQALLVVNKNTGLQVVVVQFVPAYISNGDGSVELSEDQLKYGFDYHD